MKYSVLTCNFNNYELLRTPLFVDNNAEYVCVTDNKDMKSDGIWNIVYYPDYFNDVPDINKWTYVRFHPFEFVNTDICLYLDGSIQIFSDINVYIIDRFIDGGYIYGVLPHLQTCISEQENNYDIYSDLDVWINDRGCDKDESEKVKNILRKNDIGQYSIFQGGLILYRNCKKTNTINSRIWEIGHLFGTDNIVHRDNQIAMSYVLSNEMYKSDKLITISPMILNSDYFQIFLHGVDDCIFTIYDNEEKFKVFGEYINPDIIRINHPKGR